jgi:DNA primase catalytic subunit
MDCGPSFFVILHYVQVKKVKVERRINEIVNRLNKTKTEQLNVDFRGQREERDRKEREDQKAVQREIKQKEKEEEKRKQELAEQR